MSLISIIVPCFNYGWLLAETLNSLLKQTYRNWECIIIDDGSSDNTRQVSQSFQQSDNRFHYVYQDNAGMSVARNHGLRLAKGEFIQFLDADDLLATQKLNMQADVLKNHPNIDLIYGSVRYFRHGEPTILSRSFDMLDTEWQIALNGQGPAIVESMIPRNVMVMNAPLLRATLVRKIGGFKQGLHSMEDWEFWLRCAIAGAKFTFKDTPETWAIVRVHPNSTSQNRRRMLLFEEKVRTQLDSNLNSPALAVAKSQNLQLLNALRLENARYHFQNGQQLEGLKAYWHLARSSGQYLTYLKGALYWGLKGKKAIPE